MQSIWTIREESVPISSFLNTTYWLSSDRMALIARKRSDINNSQSGYLTETESSVYQTISLQPITTLSWTDLAVSTVIQIGSEDSNSNRYDDSTDVMQSIWTVREKSFPISSFLNATYWLSNDRMALIARKRSHVNSSKSGYLTEAEAVFSNIYQTISLWAYDRAELNWQCRQ